MDNSNYTNRSFRLRWPLLMLLFSVGWLFGCTRPDSPRRLKTGPDSTWLAMKAERAAYFDTVRSMRTEYEVATYLDKNTKYMRASKVTECGGEEGWKLHLEWLKTHGGKITGFFEGGGPIYNRAPHSSPYEKYPTPPPPKEMP